MNVKILQARIILTYCEIFAVVIVGIQHSLCLTSFPLIKDSFFNAQENILQLTIKIQAP